MIRKASIMQLYKHAYEEYKRRHDELWPEMEALLKSHGVHNYSIFLHEPTGQLFAYYEIQDETLWQQIANTEICKKWWCYMQPLMETNRDKSPVTEDLKSVFYLA